MYRSLSHTHCSHPTLNESLQPNRHWGGVGDGVSVKQAASLGLWPVTRQAIAVSAKCPVQAELLVKEMGAEVASVIQFAC